MKKRPYTLLLQTPGGKCAAEADSMSALVEITPRGLFGEAVQTVTEQPTKESLEEVARDLLTAFFQEAMKHKQRFYQTSVGKAGIELDLVKCYLQGMNIEATASSLCDLSGLAISRSAVGRYWAILSKIGLDFKARL